MSSKIKKKIAQYGSLNNIPLSELQDLPEEDKRWFEQQAKSRVKRRLRKQTNDG